MKFNISNQIRDHPELAKHGLLYFKPSGELAVHLVTVFKMLRIEPYLPKSYQRHDPLAALE